MEGPVVLGHSGLCSFASLVRLAHVPVLGLAWSVVHTGYEVCCMLRCGVSVMCEDTSCEYACELITGLWRNRQVLLVVAIHSTGATAACSLVYLPRAGSSSAPHVPVMSDVCNWACVVASMHVWTLPNITSCA